jgi:membrane-associated phospholipid phosphatase
MSAGKMMKRKTSPIAVVLLLLTLPASYLFLDHPVALLVKRMWLSAGTHSFLSSEIPDLLSPFTFVVTLFSWIVYVRDRSHGTVSKRTSASLLTGLTVPVAFLAKAVLKFSFGRVNTRYWLSASVTDAFHWFRGGDNYSGFPSGHMTVLTVVILALWHVYPDYRVAYTLFLTAVPLALIATGYHFVSDVLAGACVAILINICAVRILKSTQEMPGD